MQEPARDVLSLWPAIEELALNRAKGLPVHDLLRGAKPVAYDAGSETLKLSVESPPPGQYRHRDPALVPGKGLLPGVGLCTPP